MIYWYHIAVTLALIALSGVTAWNLARFRRLPAPSSAFDDVMVSVLIPARNEERCIEACVRSLCNQTWTNLEVIVLDDGSNDATPNILARLEAEFGHVLRVVRGTPLPDGWVGKPWACHQLSQEARGNVLLFTDADTVHASTVVHSSVELLSRDKIDFFSLVPYQVMGTWAEHVVIPMVHVLYTAYLPNNLILSLKAVSLSAANGQFMCFKRDVYDAINGHVSVRNNIVEDVALARRLKQQGFRIALVDGHREVSCRMYTSLREVVDGFSKNFFPAMNFNVALMVGFVFHLVVVWVMPWLWLFGVAITSIIDPTPWPPELVIPAVVLPAIQVFLATAIRGSIAMRFAMPSWHAFLMPLSAAMAAAIGVNSMLWALSAKGPRWKDRQYSSTMLKP